MLSLPKSIKQSLGAGIGLFIAYIGFINGGLITTNSQMLSLSQLNAHNTLFLICLVCLIILFIKRFPASVIVVIIIGYIIAFPFDLITSDKIIKLPSSFIAMPDFSLFGH